MSKKNTNIITPAGIAKWCHVSVPNTKHVAEGEYSVDLALEGEDAEKLKALLDEAAEQAKQDALKNNPKEKGLILKAEVTTGYTAEIDGETGEPTGRTLFRFKNKAKGMKKDKTPFEVTIGIFDAKGKPMKGVKVGFGSKMKVSFEIVPFWSKGLKKVGVSLRLKAVQILDLKQYGGGDASSYGFGEEEGYEYDESQFSDESRDESTDTDAVDDNDGDY